MSKHIECSIIRVSKGRLFNANEKIIFITLYDYRLN